MSVVLAFDLSSTATGVCLPDGTTSTITPPPKLPFFERAQVTRNAAYDIASTEDAAETTLHMIVIEAIGTRHIQSAIVAATVHALVLDSIGGIPVLPVLKVPPKSLKKFATNNGNADKTAMVLAAATNGWQHQEGADDNQADAWHLWTLGKAMLGEWVVPETEYRKTILKQIRESAK